MEPEVEVTLGQETAGPGQVRPRPALHVRLMEMAGLALVLYGLGSGDYWPAALGGALIVGSYALYRRKHGAMPVQPQNGGSGMDGGGD